MRGIRTGHRIVAATVALVMGLTCAGPRARARPDADYRGAGDYGLFLAGAATAFLSHEGGHLLTDGLLRAHPRLRGVHLGPIPFFAIEPQIVRSDRALYGISASGFLVQNAYAEAILQTNPDLLHHHRPFLEGMLLFHALLSLGYAITGFANAGPAQSDVQSMSRGSHMKPWAVSLLVLLPAAIDTVRYLAPSAHRYTSYPGMIARLPLLGATFSF